MYEIIKPCQVLEDYIRYYWILEQDTPHMCEPYRVIPYGCVELMFYFGDPYSYASDGKNKNTMQPIATISGQQRRFYDLQPTGKIGLFAIQFKPHGAKMFFDLPIYTLTDHVFDLKDISKDGIDVLTERITGASNNHLRVTCIEEYLLQQLNEKELYNFKRMNAVINKIIESTGDCSIDSLAKTACLGYKQFDRIFSQCIGLTPKQYLTIVRFQKVLYIRQNLPHLNLSTLALECGYYDQAHCIHDFKKITGITPKNYFKTDCAFSDFFIP